MSGDGRLGKARLPRNPLSIAGLLAIVLVMAGSHVVVARYDMLALDALDERLHLHRRGPGPGMRRPIRPPSPGADSDAARSQRRGDPAPDARAIADRDARSRRSRSRRGTARSASTSC